MKRCWIEPGKSFPSSFSFNLSVKRIVCKILMPPWEKIGMHMRISHTRTHSPNPKPSLPHKHTLILWDSECCTVTNYFNSRSNNWNVLTICWHDVKLRNQRKKRDPAIGQSCKRHWAGFPRGFQSGVWVGGGLELGMEGGREERQEKKGRICSSKVRRTQQAGGKHRYRFEFICLSVRWEVYWPISC